MMTLLVIIAGLAFLCVWFWAMWVAFTQGDDIIARFGRRLLKRVMK